MLHAYFLDALWAGFWGLLSVNQHLNLRSPNPVLLQQSAIG
jgi:hypothetical protein